MLQSNQGPQAGGTVISVRRGSTSELLLDGGGGGSGDDGLVVLDVHSGSQSPPSNVSLPKDSWSGESWQAADSAGAAFYDNDSDSYDSDGDDGISMYTFMASYHCAIALVHVLLGVYELLGLFSSGDAHQSPVTPGRICVLVMLSVLAFDNTVVAIGRVLGHGWWLTTLSHGRSLLRAGATPLILLSTTELGQQAGIAWLCAAKHPPEVLVADAPTSIALACLVLSMLGLWFRVQWPRLELVQFETPEESCLECADSLLEYLPEGRRQGATSEESSLAYQIVAKWEPVCTTAVAAWCLVVGGFVLQDSDIGGQSEDANSGFIFFGAVFVIIFRIGPPLLSATAIPLAEICWLAGLVLQERELRCGKAFTVVNRECSAIPGGGQAGSSSLYGW